MEPEVIHLMSIKDAFKRGFELFKKRWGFWISLSLFSTLIPFIPDLIQNQIDQTDTLGAFFILILTVIHFLLQTFASMGMIYTSLKAARDEPYSFNDFFARLHRFPSYIWASILSALAIIGGLLLFIVPGIIFGMMFFFATWIVLDHDVSGLESLKLSKKITYGHKWNLFLFFLAILLLNLLGLLFLIVGALVTYPVTILAISALYYNLFPKNEGRINEAV